MRRSGAARPRPSVAQAAPARARNSRRAAPSLRRPGARTTRSSRIAGPSRQDFSGSGGSAIPSIATIAASAPSMPISMTRVLSRLRRRSRQSPDAGRTISGFDLAVGAADRAERAGLAGALRREEREKAVRRLVDPPVAEHDRHVGVVGLALVALDDQHAGQPASELLGRVAMRMEEEGAGVRRHEAVGEASRRAGPAAASDRARRPGRSAGGCRASGSDVCSPSRGRRFSTSASSRSPSFSRTTGRPGAVGEGPERQRRAAEAGKRLRALGGDEVERHAPSPPGRQAAAARAETAEAGATCATRTAGPAETATVRRRRNVANAPASSC